MASFARSFKPPAAYLSPCRRPGMPARTLSNSSELSLASSASGPAADDADGPVASAPGTPAVDDDKHSPDASSSTASPRPGTSRPIAIELPKMKKLNTASVYTPPEPLSARGDLPGGYFPMHEDPKARVHRPHPFHQDPALARHYLHLDTMQGDRRPPTSVTAPASAQASLPVSSYLAPGFHDTPLPLGKYYPSNYEQHQRAKGQRHRPPLPASGSLPDSQTPKSAPEPHRGDTADAEKRRKMQQYQRDMIAQAAMALGTSADKSVAGVSLSGMPPIKDAWLAGRPVSPKLHPLGSPGPVTPMELEGGAGYLEHGKAQERMPKENLIPGSSTSQTI